jgi:hypothetical protein
MKGVSMKKHDLHADRWGAVLAGIALLALPMSAALYRGAFSWLDVVVALMGIGALAAAADSFVRNARPEGLR